MFKTVLTILYCIALNCWILNIDLLELCTISNCHIVCQCGGFVRSRTECKCDKIILFELAWNVLMSYWVSLSNFYPPFPSSSSLWHLYSTFKSLWYRLSNALTVYYAAQANHLAVSCQYERKPPFPRSTPRELQLPSVLPLIHTLTHMATVDRRMVVGHVPTVHTCSFMCT